MTKLTPLAVPTVLRAPLILLVEDEPAVSDLVRNILVLRGHACDVASSFHAARERMAATAYDIVITDVHLPDGSGISLVTGAPGGPLCLVMTGSDDVQTAVAALRGGAIDYITKPFSVDQFLQRIDRAVEEWRDRGRIARHSRALETLVEVKSAELSRTARHVDEVYDMTVAALGAALNLKDNETADHCVRVSRNAVALGERLGLSGFELKNLQWGSYLHDIGKIGVPESILLKASSLTPEERRIVEKHPLMGYDMIRSIGFLAHATDVVLSHHEHYDGSGYPHGLAGEQIPLNARIFAVMDTLDAMTAARPYRAAMPFTAVIEELGRMAGSQFDPEIVEEFCAVPAAGWLLQARAA